MISPSNWEQIRALFHTALERAPDERAAFLRAQSSDDEILREVASLLAAHEDADALLAAAGRDEADASPGQAGALRGGSPTATLPSGAQLGPYVVVCPLGAGAMGEVYRARDTNLRREVALKVLPEALAANRDRLARFTREARMLGALNHPHIAQVHGFEEHGGVRALVMELVEGQNLAQHVTRGPIRVEEALRIARQIAEALEAAHARGIVHRDLKPANIMIRDDGTVKVLDFGLAKAWMDDVGSATSPAAPAAAPTMATPPIATEVGVLVGTAAYMSPEQARGAAVDKGSDIWAFGCVLYEMLTGARAFDGASAADTLANVLQRDPAWDRLPDTTPPSIRVLLRRCLRKDRRERLHDAAGVRIEIDDVLHDLNGSAPTLATTDQARGQTFWVAAAVVAVIVTGAVVWNLKTSSAAPSRAVTRLAVPVTPDQRPAALTGLALSADGRHLVYVSDGAGTARLCVRAMDDSEARMLLGTEGARYPFLSPDGQWIGFFANGTLKKIPVAGGPVVSVLDLSSVGTAAGGVWGPDDTIFFAGGEGIWKISAAGGSPKPVTTVERSRGEISHNLPFLLPDGRTLLYTIWYGPGWDEKQIVAQRLATGERRALIRGAGTVRYAPTGHLIYTRAGAMMAMRFDALRLEVSGAPITLLENLREGTPNADYALSSEGSLAYVQQSPDAYNRLPVLVDRNGAAHPLPGIAPAYYQNPTFSPDGRRVALNITGALIDVWIYDVERASLTRLTTEGSSQDPVWSPNGKRIAYRATRSGSRNLFWKSVDGTTAEERLTTGGATQTPWSWSPDGTLAFEEAGSGTRADIWMLPVAGDRKPRPLLRETFNESRPRFSPDGSWLAYVSDRSGRAEIYVQSYPLPGRRWQISTGGGQDPTWARDGRELFYRDGRKVMSVQIARGSTLSPSTPRLLFEGDYIRAEPVIDFDVHPDGQRFLMIQQSRPDPPVTHINVVLNAFEELRRRLPARQ